MQCTDGVRRRSVVERASSDRLRHVERPAIALVDARFHNPSEDRLTHLRVNRQDGSLYVAGVNALYHLDAQRLTTLESVQIGPKVLVARNAIGETLDCL